MSSNNSKFASGFTLIELIVVISLISMMLFLALPRLQSTLLFDSRKKAARWIIASVRSLRENALRGQKSFVLVVDLESQSLWATTEKSPEEEIESAKLNEFLLPENLKIIDVAYPLKGKVSSGQTEIRFYKKGYSDKALIHLEDDDNNQFTLAIEPFLSKIGVYEEYIGFEE